MNVQSTNDYLECITDIDDFDDLAPAGIIINGIFNLQQFRSLAYQTFGPKTKLFFISQSQCCIIVDMNMNTMRTKYLRHIESMHFDVRKIFLKSPSKDKSIVSYVPIETFCSFDTAKYYLYFPNHDDTFLSNEQFFPISSRIETNSIRSEYIAYEYNNYSELVKAYEFMLNEQFNQEIIVISPRFITELKSLIATNHNLLYLSIIKDNNYSENRILELMKSTRENPTFPTFIPYDQCYYLSFDPLIYKLPTRIDNPHDIYPLNHIRDIQISYLHKNLNESERLFEQPRTFIGFYDLIDLYRGYHYFSTEEAKSDLRIESSFQRKEYYSRLNISQQFYYIEINYDFHQIDEQYFYSIDFEDICYCGEDEEGHRTIVISFNNEREFESIIYEFMNIMNLSFNIEELEIDLFQDDDLSKPNHQLRNCCNCVRFQVRKARHISDNESNEQNYIKKLIPSDFTITKESNQKYKITTQSKNEKTKLNSLYSKLHEQQRIKVFYPYNIHQQTKPIQEIHKKDNPIQEIQKQPTESKTETNQGIKTNIFKPKRNLYYLYFEENPKGKPHYPTNVVHNAFGLRNIQDLQRNYYLPNDQTQIKNYTFIGLKTKAEIKSALSTTSLISSGISGTFHEYSPDLESTNAIQNTKQDFNKIFSITEVNQTVSTNNSPTSDEKDEKANPITERLETSKKSIEGKESHQINERNIKPTANSSAAITDDKSSISRVKEESQAKNNDRPKLDTKQNITKPPEIAPNNQPLKKEQPKVVDKDTFVCNENLIYIYLKEKNQVRTNQSTKQEKKNLFGVKDCEHIQRYKYHPTKNDKVLYTFFGFLSYSKAQENIRILENKWISDGAIDIYETTEALEAYKETLNQPKQVDPKSNENVISQPLATSDMSIPQSVPKSRIQANISKIKPQVYRVLDLPNSFLFPINKRYFTNAIFLTIQTIQFSTIKPLYRNFIRNAILYDYSDTSYDFLEMKNEFGLSQTIQKMFQACFEQVSKSPVRFLPFDPFEDENATFVITEHLIPPDSIRPFYYYIVAIQGFENWIEHVFLDGEIQSIFFFEQFSKELVMDIERYLVKENLAFDSSKYPIENTIIINEKMVLKNENDFDVIVEYIKSSTTVSPIYTARNLLFVHHLKKKSKRGLISKYSFIVFKNEQEKMTALNNINSILFRHANALTYNPSLFYVRYDIRKINQEYRKEFLNAIKKLPGCREIQNSVFSIENPCDRLYIAFDTYEHRRMYSKYIDCYARDFNLYGTLNTFLPDENLYYFFATNLEEEASDILENSCCAAKDIQVTYYLHHINMEGNNMYFFGFESEKAREVGLESFQYAYIDADACILGSLFDPPDRYSTEDELFLQIW